MMPRVVEEYYVVSSTLSNRIVVIILQDLYQLKTLDRSNSRDDWRTSGFREKIAKRRRVGHGIIL
jgi:hypothetical protein